MILTTKHCHTWKDVWDYVQIIDENSLTCEYLHFAFSRPIYGDSIDEYLTRIVERSSKIIKHISIRGSGYVSGDVILNCYKLTSLNISYIENEKDLLPKILHNNRNTLKEIQMDNMDITLVESSPCMMLTSIAIGRVRYVKHELTLEETRKTARRSIYLFYWAAKGYITKDVSKKIIQWAWWNWLVH